METIRVVVRVRPNADPGRCVLVTGPKTLVVTHPSSLADANDTPASGSKHEPKSFEFDRVIDGGTQEEVFESVSPLVHAVTRGYNATVFAYGCTGSGKTHTMLGAAGNEGVVPRALSLLFSEVGARMANQSNAMFHVALSFLELYNNSFVDLLQVSQPQQRCRIELRDRGDRMRLEGSPTLRMPVKSSEEAMALIQRGTAGRAMGCTDLNEHSSRSHALVLVDVESSEGDGPVCMGCLYLVDLAGSERLKLSNATGSTLKETQNINLSLTALCDVLSALCKHQGKQQKQRRRQQQQQQEEKQEKQGEEEGEETEAEGATEATAGVAKEQACGQTEGGADGRAAPAGRARDGADADGAVTRGGGQQPLAAGFVPYRNSKLTFLLKNSIGGNAKTVMITTLRTEQAGACHEVLMSLKYASRARQIQNHAGVNMDRRGTSSINIAYADFERLQRQLWQRSAHLAQLQREHALQLSLHERVQADQVARALQQLRRTHEAEKAEMQRAQGSVLHGQRGALEEQRKAFELMEQRMGESGALMERQRDKIDSLELEVVAAQQQAQQAQEAAAASAAAAAKAAAEVAASTSETAALAERGAESAKLLAALKACREVVARGESQVAAAQDGERQMALRAEAAERELSELRPACSAGVTAVQRAEKEAARLAGLLGDEKRNAVAVGLGHEAQVQKMCVAVQTLGARLDTAMARAAAAEGANAAPALSERVAELEQELAAVQSGATAAALAEAGAAFAEREAQYRGAIAAIAVEGDRTKKAADEAHESSQNQLRAAECEAAALREQLEEAGACIKAKAAECTQLEAELAAQRKQAASEAEVQRARAGALAAELAEVNGQTAQMAVAAQAAAEAVAKAHQSSLDDVQEDLGRARAVSFVLEQRVAQLEEAGNDVGNTQPRNPSDSDVPVVPVVLPCAVDSEVCDVEAARDQLAGQVDVLKSKWQEAQDSGSASAQRIQELESQMRLIEGKYEEAVRAVQRSRSDDSPALAILERFSRRARFGRRGVNSRSNGVKKLQSGESPRSVACLQSPLARSGGGVGRAVNFYQ